MNKHEVDTAISLNYFAISGSPGILWCSHLFFGAHFADEVEGREYHFVSKDEFQQLIRDNDLIEYGLNEDNGHYYGTMRLTREAVLSAMAHAHAAVSRLKVETAFIPICA